MTRLKAYRTLIGQTQREFAEYLGVPYSTLCYWEQGKGDPPPIVYNLIRHLHPIPEDVIEVQMQKPNSERVKRA